jgi:DNA-binding CsgD family transcriptional regulator
VAGAAAAAGARQRGGRDGGRGDIAWELLLSLHAVRERLARLEAKLGVHTAAEAVARALREST